MKRNIEKGKEGRKDQSKNFLKRTNKNSLKYCVG